MKLVALCETLTFQSYTRRATLEAIARLTGSLDIVCRGSLRDRHRATCTSAYATVRMDCRIAPLRWSEATSGPAALVARYRARRARTALAPYDVLILTSPFQAAVASCFDGPVITVLSDPYHFFQSVSFENERCVLERADIIFSTSSQLRDHYLPTYFGIAPERARYWPNTVDLEVWDIEKHPSRPTSRGNPVIGYAGNFCPHVVDLELLDEVTRRVTDCRFQLTGQYKTSDPDFISRLEAIFARDHVEYLGYTPYSHLPSLVASWDAGIMLDDVSEFSSYVHHNKLYQYLALGKPVVTQAVHTDYDPISDVVFIANSVGEYVSHLRSALDCAADHAFRERCVVQARANSSDVRARQFVEALTRLHHS